MEVVVRHMKKNKLGKDIKDQIKGHLGCSMRDITTNIGLMEDLY
jgi:hypothetical protein